MKETFIIFGLIIITLLSACKKESPNPLEQTPKLLFSSGFESNTYIEINSDPDYLDYRSIEGTDTETGFSWPIDILGASRYSGLHYVDDNNSKAIESEIQKVIGHNGNPTMALYNIEHYIYNDLCTQCPYEILDLTDGTKDLYIRYWIKLDSASLVKPNKWRTFFEWKTKDYERNRGFRLISFIYSDDDGVPYWHWQGDKNPEHPIWEIDNKEVPIPLNKWFLTEFYWHWSEGDDGRALWKINGQVIGDHYGPTTRKSKPIDFIMITQIYGNSNPKYQWIDDIEIWNTLIE